jgi:hypothetical protein
METLQPASLHFLSQRLHFFRMRQLHNQYSPSKSRAILHAQMTIHVQRQIRKKAAMASLHRKKQALVNRKFSDLNQG